MNRIPVKAHRLFLDAGTQKKLAKEYVNFYRQFHFNDSIRVVMVSCWENLFIRQVYLSTVNIKRNKLVDSRFFSFNAYDGWFVKGRYCSVDTFITKKMFQPKGENLKPEGKLIVGMFEISEEKILILPSGKFHVLESSPIVIRKCYYEDAKQEMLEMKK